MKNIKGLKPIGIKRLFSCWRKKRYDKMRKATLAAEKKNMGFYRCDDCKGWHLTKHRPNYGEQK